MEKTFEQKQAEALAMLANVIEITESSIAALEEAIASDLNKGRYVILMDSSVIAACKRLPVGFNFSAMGTDAATFTEREAERHAPAFERETGRRMTLSPVFPYYTQALDSARRNLAFYRDTMKGGK